MEPESAASKAAYARRLSSEVGISDGDLLRAGHRLQKSLGRDSMVEVSAPACPPHPSSTGL
jgi:hypothetical protein